MTLAAETLEPPAEPSRRADLAKDTSAPASTRKALAEGEMRAPQGMSSASARGMTVFPAASRHLRHENPTSPSLVASVRRLRSWMRSPSGSLEQSRSS